MFGPRRERMVCEFATAVESASRSVKPPWMIWGGSACYHMMVLEEGER